jgi:hypothetical protein
LLNFVQDAKGPANRARGEQGRPGGPDVWRAEELGVRDTLSPVRDTEHEGVDGQPDEPVSGAFSHFTPDTRLISVSLILDLQGFCLEKVYKKSPEMKTVTLHPQCC